jgi:hypothetical protein
MGWLLYSHPVWDGRQLLRNAITTGIHVRADRFWVSPTLLTRK